jgi:hypothetical protein
MRVSIEAAPTKPVARLGTRAQQGPCLDAKFIPKFHYVKRRFPITSKCRHMYGVLNVDKIKK